MKRSAIRILLALLLCAVISVSMAESADVLKTGDAGDAVLELNTRLRQLNYTTVRANDQFGPATEAAVKAVQAAYGLEETGVADQETLNNVQQAVQQSRAPRKKRVLPIRTH